MENIVTRKDFFKQAFGIFKKEVDSGIDLNNNKTIPFILPPGVENIDSFIETCDQSYECVAACPHEAIEHSSC